MSAEHPIRICSVDSRSLQKEFIDFPHRLYRNDRAYVPRLFLQQQEQLSRSNPYYEHSTAGFFLARRNGETVGRIAWFLNTQHITFSGRREMFFGFFDAINDQDAADALFDAVHEQAAAQGCSAVLGPIEFSTNDTCGLLIDGCDIPPTVLMPYNAPYYRDLLLSARYEQVQELQAYELFSANPPAFLRPFAERCAERLAARGIRVRPMDFTRFNEEIETLYPLYGKIFSENWGYMPLSHSDFVHQAKDLRQISLPEFVLIAEDRGTPIGYAVGIFDANAVFSSFRNGRLLPFNFVHLPRIKRVRRTKIINLGVIPEYRSMGIDAVMYDWFYTVSTSHHIESVEASYVMGSNSRMQSALAKVNGRLTKRYAIYRRPLDVQSTRDE